MSDICNEQLSEQVVGGMGFKKKDYDDFKKALWFSEQPSVDAFLEHRPKLVEIGKAVIAEYLIRCERGESLFGQEQSWYKYVLNKMDSSFEDFGKNALSVITFNYDRSFEYYLSITLQERYGKSEEEVGAKLQGIPVIHVYGQLGVLPWQTKDRPEARSYEPHDGKMEEIRKAARGINIVSEADEDTPEFTEARLLQQKAERIYFLGFGYHKDNMRRLKVPLVDKDGYDGNRIIRGSCFGFTRAEVTGLRDVKYRGLHLGDEGHNAYQFLRNEGSFVTD